MKTLTYPAYFHLYLLVLLVLATGGSAGAQNRHIAGQVTHAETGQAISHATVRLGKQQAIIDQAGRFRFGPIPTGQL